MLVERILERPGSVSLAEMADAVIQGVPANELRPLISGSLLRWPEVAKLIGPKRTLERRLAANDVLTVEEGDRLVRTARIIGLTMHVFSDKTEAWEWLRTPKQFLAGRTPLDMMASEAGGLLVVERLEQSRWGYNA
jgi:putative toxin-antitoxin system antitoxin component (TIGR02293 family)